MDASKYLGNYLRAEDLKEPKTLTISNVLAEKIGREGETKQKLVLQFAEVEQGVPLNKTNLKLCIKFFGTADTEEWKGKKIVVFNDPAVAYKGQMIGGLRLKLPA